VPAGASRERLTAPVQAVMLLIVAFLLGSGFCCAPSAVEESEFSAAYPGEEAGAVAEARAVVLQDKIQLYMRERADLEQRRDALLKDAASYRAKSAAVWTDRGLAEREQDPMARQYSASAEDAEAKAQRFQERIESYSAQIALIENKRQNELYQAHKYENMTEPLPY